VRVTTNESPRRGADMIIALRFARELDCRHLFNLLARSPWCSDNSSHYRSTLQNRRLARVPPWFLGMELSQQQNIRVLVSRAETKMLEDGTIQRQLAGIYKLSPAEIDELIDYFQPYWRGAPGGGSKRLRRQNHSYSFENGVLPSLYNTPLTRPDMNSPIFQSSQSHNQLGASAGFGSRHLSSEYPNNFSKLNKGLQEDHTTVENSLNPNGISGNHFNPGQNIIGSQRWDFQGHFTPPAYHPTRGRSYPMHNFRQSRISPSAHAHRRRARHSSLMTPEGTYIPFEKFTRARTPSAQLFLHPELSYTPVEQISNPDTRLHLHPNQKQAMENGMSNVFLSPTENTHELNFDGLNSHVIHMPNLEGISEGKLSDTDIMQENLVDEKSKKAEKPARSTSAPMESLHTPYPLTVKNLASYNKQVAPFNGDYKTIVRRWLSKSI